MRMRHVTTAAGLGAVLLLAGCNQLWHKNPSAEVATQPLPRDLTAAKLVAYMNDNAAKVQTVRCNGLDLDCKQGFQSVHLTANMACQKPNGFRLVAKAVSDEVDLGSNSQEFWFWVKRNDPPYLFHCSYDEFRRGNVSLPFPFQPEWIIEAMGIAQYDPAKEYKLTPKGNTIELVEAATSPQGRPIKKVTVFNRNATPAGTPQVIAHKLLDEKDKEICTAQIYVMQVDPVSQAVIPRRVHLVWPSEKLEMRLTLDKTQINPPIDDQVANRLFGRPQLQGVQSYDLARRGVDSPTSLQRVRGQAWR